jgi:F0F1-type ATP synthase assembly protein I
MENYPQGERGKCRTCGFCSKRVSVQDGSRSAPVYLQISSVERWERDVDLLPGMVTNAGQVLGFAPVYVQLACFRGIAELHEGNQAEELDRDRNCPYWYPYMPGFNPQRHLEDLRMQELEALRAQTEAAREHDRRAYEERSEERRQRFEEELTKRTQDLQTQRELSRQDFDRAMQKQNRTLLILGIILAFIVGVAQFFGTFLAARMSAKPSPPIEQPSQQR